MHDSPDDRLMDGRRLAQQIHASTQEGATKFLTARGRPPRLATVLVGDDPASVTYVRMKRRRAEQVGIDTRMVDLPASTPGASVVAAVGELSADDDVDGILVQHPVPAHVDERAVFEAIDPAKDVDGVTMQSLAGMALGLRGFSSATPGGILRLLDHYGVDLAGAHSVVIGRSPILGKPVGLLLLARDSTVTFAHSKTTDLPAVVASADLVVAAVGRPEFIRGQWIKPGAVVVDAGYNPGDVGDVAHAEAVGRARLITPVPGGVGPMTIAVLLEQTLQAALARTGPRSPDRVS